MEEDLRRELAELRMLLDRQQTEISSLRAELADRGAEPAQMPSSTRRQLLLGISAAAVGGAVAASATPAEAANGDPLRCGVSTNTATSQTLLKFTYPPDTYPDTYLPGLAVTDHETDTTGLKAAVAGLVSAEGRHGLYALDSSDAGAIATLSVSGNGDGMFGLGWGGTGVTGYGGNVGVFAYSSTGIGLVASTTTAEGTALVVNGVHRAQRVGRVRIPRGGRKATVQLDELSATSIVLATPQNTTGRISVSGVTIRKRKPTAFTIYLNQGAPAGGLDVGWVVIDMLGDVMSRSVENVASAADRVLEQSPGRRKSR